MSVKAPEGFSSWDEYYEADVAARSANSAPAAAAADELELRFVTLDEFADREEAGAAALLGGDSASALIPEGGDVMVYGDGGAGKTTLVIDLGFHLAAGDAWLGIPVARPLRVALIENEGRGRCSGRSSTGSGSAGPARRSSGG